MEPTCMTCGKKIEKDDLGAKFCIKAAAEEKNPFHVPVSIDNPIHLGTHVCGHCAKGKDDCPCCGDQLVYEDIVHGARSLNELGKKEFKRLGLSGKFRSTFISGNEIYISYLREGKLSETFWREI